MPLGIFLSWFSPLLVLASLHSLVFHAIPYKVSHILCYSTHFHCSYYPVVGNFLNYLFIIFVVILMPTWIYISLNLAWISCSHFTLSLYRLVPDPSPEYLALHIVRILGTLPSDLFQTFPSDLFQTMCYSRTLFFYCLVFPVLFLFLLSLFQFFQCHIIFISYSICSF